MFQGIWRLLDSDKRKIFKPFIFDSPTMSMGMSMSLRLEPRLVLTQSQALYETSGDLELLSLHRIKNRIPTMQVHDIVKRKLVTELIRENQEYQRVAKNKKMCITPNALDNAVYATGDFLAEQRNLGLATVDDLKQRSAFERLMTKQIGVQTNVIKNWFSDNYDQLIYDMEAKIPWPIIVRMRAQLGRWALGETNPFNQPIEQLIEETASFVGLNPNNYDSSVEMWDALKKYNR